METANRNWMAIEARSQFVIERRSQSDNQLVKTETTALTIPMARRPENRTRSRAITSSAMRANRCVKARAYTKDNSAVTCSNADI